MFKTKQGIPPCLRSYWKELDKTHKETHTLIVPGDPFTEKAPQTKEFKQKMAGMGREFEIDINKDTRSDKPRPKKDKDKFGFKLPMNEDLRHFVEDSIRETRRDYGYYHRKIKSNDNNFNRRDRSSLSNKNDTDKNRKSNDSNDVTMDSSDDSGIAMLFNKAGNTNAQKQKVLSKQQRDTRLKSVTELGFQEPHVLGALELPHKNKAVFFKDPNQESAKL